VDNIRMDLREVRLGGGVIDWIGLAQDRNKWRALVNEVITFFRFHKNVGGSQVAA
jgi:hypothetical protein